MRKLAVLCIKDELLNKEMKYEELDNFMMDNGYLTSFDDSGVTKEIKQDLNICYTAEDTGECEVQIFFEILINNSKGYSEEDFYLKVTGVYEF